MYHTLDMVYNTNLPTERKIRIVITAIAPTDLSLHCDRIVTLERISDDIYLSFPSSFSRNAKHRRQHLPFAMFCIKRNLRWIPVYSLAPPSIAIVCVSHPFSFLFSRIIYFLLFSLSLPVFLSLSLLPFLSDF